MKKHVIICFLILASVLRVSTQNLQQEGSITGQIFSDIDSNALGEATIVLNETKTGTTTNVNGFFTLNNIHPGTYSISVFYIGFDQVTMSNLSVKDGEILDIGKIELRVSGIKLSEVTVTPGSFSLMGSTPVSQQTLQQNDLKNRSWAEDLTRAVTRLPGVASNDFSSKFTVRGGESNEVLMILDGMELYEPFHQRDFQGGLFSIIDIETIRSVDLFTGGFSAEFGQRQSAVFKMNSKSIADNTAHTSLGLNVVNVRGYTDGNFNQNRGKYMISAREGILGLLLKAANATETLPTYSDALIKIEYKLSNKHFLSFQNLYAGDRTVVNDIKPDNYDEHKTRYTSNYSWITLKSILKNNLFVRSLLYGGYIAHTRNGLFKKRDYTDKGDFTITDKRAYTYGGLKQDWTWDVSNQLAIKAGFDIRQLSADYNYTNHLKEIRINKNDNLFVFEGNVHVQPKPNGQLMSIYLSGKSLILENLIAEYGLRYDVATYAGDHLLSPRLGLTYSFGKNTFLRAAYGHYYQSQFINDLDVQHNITTFNPAELSKHYVMGFEHVFKNSISVRVETYYKDISRIRPKYEKLSDPWDLFTESRADVLKLNIQNASSKGIELFVKYDQGKKVSYWFSYSLARAEDNIKSIEFDGIYQLQTGKLPRALNQTTTVYADINYRINSKWQISLSWQFYNGVPLTTYEYAWQQLPADNALGLETLAVIPNGDLQFYQKYHVFRGEKYTPYHKADIRINRRFELKHSQITAFIQVINLYNRSNLRNFDLSITDGDSLITDGNGSYKSTPDHTYWFGVTPILGISWDFYKVKSEK
ncbi:MAG: TonB-dependent receptor [Saprospiraceae bacterium]